MPVRHWYCRLLSIPKARVCVRGPSRLTRDGEERLQAIVEPGQWQSARSLGRGLSLAVWLRQPLSLKTLSSGMIEFTWRALDRVRNAGTRNILTDDMIQSQSVNGLHGTCFSVPEIS